jgi:hypothetical protein
MFKFQERPLGFVFRSWIPQNVMPGFLSAHPLDQPGFQQRSQQVHRALSGHAQCLPYLPGGHATVVAQKVEQLLLPWPQHQFLARRYSEWVMV